MPLPYAVVAVLAAASCARPAPALDLSQPGLLLPSYRAGLGRGSYGCFSTRHRRGRHQVTVIIAMRLMSHGRCELFVWILDTCRSQWINLHDDGLPCTTEPHLRCQHAQILAGRADGHCRKSKSTVVSCVQALGPSATDSLISTRLLMTAKSLPRHTICRSHRPS